MAEGQKGGPSGENGPYTGKADAHVPIFDNQQKSYKEFKKRCDLYRKKMELANRTAETIYNIVTLMTGKAWDVVEDISVEELQRENAYDMVFRRLDSVFRYDALTELPEDFEHFFMRLQRKQGQTLQDYQAEYMRAERRLRQTHEVNLPEKVRAWWYLRRAGISREQRQLVLSNIGTERLNLEAVEKAMSFILGQDSKPESTKVRFKDTYFAEDYVNDTLEYQDEDAFWIDGAADEADWSYAESEGSVAYDEALLAGDQDWLETYDVEEYDEIHANYMEAKAKLNMMRTNRGFYPVVAMVNHPPGGQRPLFQREGKGRSKSKDKSKSKGKGSSGFIKGSTAKSRGRQVMGKQLCLRCGMAGHFARNCPTAENKKRKTEGEDASVMMVEPYNIEDGDSDYEVTNTAQQDGGAASVLGSRHHIRKYLRFLLEQGFDLQWIDVFRCKKGFRYGNSEREITHLCVLLPVHIGGRKIKVLCYVNQGTAPILFGRPILEKLGLTVDHGQKKMRWPGQQWEDIPLGKRGEYLLNLVEEGKMQEMLHEEIDWSIYIPEDFEDHIDVENPMPVDMILGDIDNCNVDEVHAVETEVPESTPTARHVEMGIDASPATPERITEEEPAEEPGDLACEGDGKESSGDSGTPASPADDDSETEMDRVCRLKGKQMRWMMYGAETAIKHAKVMLAEAARVPNRGEYKRVIWEVFVGKGRTAHYLKKNPNVEVEVFSLQTGWDFHQASHRKKFLNRLHNEKPDETPMCRLWSSLQNLATAAHPEREETLRLARKENHDTILVMCATAYEYQRRGLRHAHIEHPASSLAWRTEAFYALKGYMIHVDQCMYGLLLPDDDGNWLPAKKPTYFLSTKSKMFIGLSWTCSKDHDHQLIEGYVPGHGMRSEMAESYPPKLARRLAQLMAHVPTEEDDVYALGNEEAEREEEGPLQPVLDEEGERIDDDSNIRKNKELKAKVGPRAYQYVQRLHKNLGHPAPDVLQKMLEEVQATENVLEAARQYQCPKCYARQGPSGVPPAAPHTAREFNCRLMIDSAWIDTEDGRRCILTIMDQASRYISVRLMRTEQSTDFVKGLERSWVKHFGVPKIIRVDEAKGWAAKHVREWCANHGIVLEVAPAESHNWLGAVERKHQVVRRALELYMDDLGGRTEKHLLEAAIYVPHQINNMSFVRGFTPTQWVMGKAVASTLSLTAETFNPGVDEIDEPTAFAAVQRRRLRAQEAFIRADNDARLRRAMNRNFKENGSDCAVGQKIWYWRVAGTGILTKAKWRGPARIVAIETNDENKPIVTWVAHGTNLLRCSPRQVRPLVEEGGFPQAANPAAALADLQELKARSTTQFRDIASVKGGPDMLDEPLIEDQMSDYEPSIMGEDEVPRLPSVGSDLDAALPGAVKEALKEKIRELELLNPEENVKEKARTGEGAGLIETFGKKRRKMDRSEGKIMREGMQPAQEGGSSASASLPAVEHIPVPDGSGDELMVDEDGHSIDDVRFVEHESVLPKGWKVIDDGLELDEIYVNREMAKRKNEVREKTLTVDEREQFIEGKKKELESFFGNNVWQFASDEDIATGRIVTARWVLTWKKIEGTTQWKAKVRLVLRGFEDPDVGKLDKASPTAGRSGKMIMLMITADQRWTLHCGDVRSAFLSGVEFERVIVVRLPKDAGPLFGFHDGRVPHMRMLKSAYGLADAPLLWYKEADRRLRAASMKSHPLDKCTYMIYNPQSVLVGMAVLHVDDMLISGNLNDPHFVKVLKKVKDSFDFGKWDVLKNDAPITYCGGRIQKVDKEITLDYEEYIKKVAPVTVPKGMVLVGPLNPAMLTKVRGLIGALQWPAGQGCPHLCASISIQAGGIKTGDGHYLAELNKSLRFAKNNAQVKLRMREIGGSFVNIAFICFSDAALAVRQDLGSQGGFLIVAADPAVLDGKAVPYSVVSWRSFKLPRVARSSLSAEAKACAMALDELLYIKMMYGLLLNPHQSAKDVAAAAGGIKCAIVTDAKALYDAVKRENIQQSLDKRAALEIMCIKEMISELKAQWRWVSSERQIADGLTKVAARQQMADMLEGGHIKLVHDPNFQAAKKKSKEQLEASRAESKSPERPKGKGRGGRKGGGIAASVAANNIMATMAAGAVAGVKSMEVNVTYSDVDDIITKVIYGDGYMLEIFLGIFLLMLITLAVLFGKCWGGAGSQILQKEVRRLEGELAEVKAELVHEQDIRKLARDDANHWERQVEEAERVLRDHCNRRYFVTPHGKRVHMFFTCPHIHGHEIREFTPCATCTTALSRV